MVTGEAEVRGCEGVGMVTREAEVRGCEGVRVWRW